MASEEKETRFHTAVALTELERDALDGIARRDVRSKSATIRWLIIEEARRRGDWTEKQDSANNGE